MKNKIPLILSFFFLLLVLIACSKSTESEKQVATPVYNPPAGNYAASQEVEIECSTKGAEIRFTKDGTEPTELSDLYTESITVSENTTLKARGYLKGWKESSVATAIYNITGKVSEPYFSPPGGIYLSPQEIEIFTDTEEAFITYTTDGSSPSETSTIYTTPIMVTEDTTIKAMAFLEGWEASEIVQASYRIMDLTEEGLVYVEGGSFNVTSYYHVTVSSFCIGVNAVTQEEYLDIMGYNPSWFNDDLQRPVERISWFQAIEYCNRRSINEGLNPCYSYDNYGTNPDDWPNGWNEDNENHDKISCDWSSDGYRLPTEMEWMFAAKGGILSEGYRYSGSDDIDEVAWYWSNSGGITHPVGLKAANELGAYDMSGNVWEWCWDISAVYPEGSFSNPKGGNQGAYRVKRGGSAYSSSYGCRVDYRHRHLPVSSSNFNGFRICRVLF